MDARGGSSAVEAGVVSTNIFFPYVTGKTEASRIGVQIEGHAVDYTRWIGKNSFVVYRLHWSDEYQPDRETLNWPEWVDRDMDALKPWRVLLNIKCAPTWARGATAAECDIADIEAYAAFAKAAAQRYLPWMVSVGNEPEVSAQDAKAAGVDHHLGGFGLEQAEKYGELVTAAYDALHPLGVPVVAGELMLANTEFWALARQACIGKYDYVAFHAYTEWPTGLDCVSQKAAQLATLGDRRLICTETNYLTHPDGTHADTFDQDQADYLQHAFNEFHRAGVEALAIYAMRSWWRGADLIDGHGPRPAWYAYRDETGKEQI